MAASLSLVKFGKKALVPLLVALESQNKQTREYALWGLEESKYLEGVNISKIIEALKDPEPSIRIKAASVLGKTGNLAAVQPLIEALNDAEHETRQYAAEALGRLGDPRAIQPLRDALGDNDRDEREMCIISLAMIQDQEIFSIFKELDIGYRLIHNGKTRKNESSKYAIHLEPLSKKIVRGDEIVRQASALALSIIGGPRATKILIQVYNSDICEGVRVKALQALGIIGSTQAKQFLRQAATDSAAILKWEAIRALVYLNDTGAVKPLLGLLKDLSPGNRKRASLYLSQITSVNPTALQLARASLIKNKKPDYKEATKALKFLEDYKNTSRPNLNYLEDEKYYEF